MRLLSALYYQLSSDPAQIAAFDFSKSVTVRHLSTTANSETIEQDSRFM